MEEGTERPAESSEGTRIIFGNEVSILDIISEVLQETGKADIKLCTFSIGEEAIRGFLGLIDDGLIGDLTIVTDFTVKKNKLGMLLFASETASVFLNDVHAKVVHISNANHKATIVTTSNLNKIKRYEASVIYVDSAFCDHFSEKIDDLIQNSIPFTPGD